MKRLNQHSVTFRVVMAENAQLQNSRVAAGDLKRRFVN